MADSSMNNHRQRTLHDLLQPYGGLFAGNHRHDLYKDEPSIITRCVRLGDMSQIVEQPFNDAEGISLVKSLTTCGTGLTYQEALVPAIGEGIERYSVSMFNKEQFIHATAKELGSQAIDLEAIPRCSEGELAHPRCPLVAPDREAPRRWVKGISLMNGNTICIPAIMVYLYFRPTSQAERIWAQITTGCAAHTSYEQALVNAILEVIERDAIALTWLQKMPLPKISVDPIPATLVPYFRAYETSSASLSYSLFNATTDLGVPIVYGLQACETSNVAANLVSCSAAMDPAVAISKVMRDMVSFRHAYRGSRQYPDNWDDFNHVRHGASFMARKEQSAAFDFLKYSRDTVPLASIASIKQRGPREDLQHLLGILRCHHLEAFAVDLTTDESVRAGMRTVRVIIPGLQPLPYVYRARYLGHPRLYEAPRRMGYLASPEQNLNHWPQPFS